jgi:hypothetical protein
MSQRFGTHRTKHCLRIGAPENIADFVVDVQRLYGALGAINTPNQHIQYQRVVQ